MNEIISPADWPKTKGFAPAIQSSDGHLFISGQIGWNDQFVFETDDFVEQCEQALANAVAIVDAAGGRANDITRLTWFITDKRAYLARQKELGEAYRRVMGRHFPAMSVVVVAGLLEDRAQVEIEATAVILA